MNDKQRNLESLRRVVDRLRKIGDDSFSANLAQALEQEMSRLDPDTPPPASADQEQKTTAPA